MKCKLCGKEISEGSEEICTECREKLSHVALDSTDLPSLGRRPSESDEPKPEAAQQRGRVIWRSNKEDELQTVWPLSVAVHPSGDLLVLDEPDDYRILRFDNRGVCKSCVCEIANDDVDGAIDDPRGICIDYKGNIYIPDAGNDRIAIWNPDGTFANCMGEAGDEPGQFAHPGDVDVDRDGYIYVADSYNGRIQKLSPEGLVNLEVSQLGSWGVFEEPVAVTTNDEGHIFVADCRRNLVVIMSPDGEMLRRFPETDEDPLFDEPTDIRIGSDGSFFVADRSNLRVRRFSAGGKITGIVDLSQGEEVHEGGDIALLGDNIVVPDRGNDQILCMELEDVS
ncbi:MAG: NHL repeat-containing protein [Planctomycetes bacterium]|nr:NHL repeat-containing protein [Planctomycetota bacterium]